MKIRTGEVKPLHDAVLFVEQRDSGKWRWRLEIEELNYTAQQTVVCVSGDLSEVLNRVYRDLPRGKRYIIKYVTIDAEPV